MKKRKWLSWLLVVCMVLTLLPVYALADELDEPAAPETEAAVEAAPVGEEPEGDKEEASADAVLLEEVIETKTELVIRSETPEPVALTLGVPQTVTGADGETAVQRFTFTAPVTGAYEFYTGAAGENVSTSLNIFCEDESGVESVSYDYALDDTVSLIAALTEGVTYLLDAYGYVDEGSASFTVTVTAFPSRYAASPALTPGTTQTAAYDGSATSGVFLFTPAEEGRYAFLVEEADCNVEANVTDKTGDTFMGGYYEAGSEDNVMLVAFFEAGETYLVRTKGYIKGETGYTYGTYSIKVIPYIDLFADAPVLELNVPQTVTVTGGEEMTDAAFRFTPAVTGTYTFTMNNPSGYFDLVDKLGLYMGDSLRAYDETSISITNELTGGETYIVETGSSSGSNYTVLAEKTAAITDVTLSLVDPDAALISGDTTMGSWNTYTSGGETVKYFWFYYNRVADMFQATITYDNGTTQVIPGGEISDFDYDCREWTVGGTNNLVSARIAGRELSVNIPVADMASAYDSAPELVAGTPQTVNYNGTEASGLFRFVPAVAGTYEIYSEGSVDTFVTLCDELGNELSRNDDGGSGSNFKLTLTPTVGNTYLVKTRLYDSSGSGTYTVRAERVKAVESLTVTLKDADASLTVGDTSIGSWRTYYDSDDTLTRYFEFGRSAIGGLLNITATYDDETTADLTYGDNGVSLTYDCKTWTAGGTANTVTVSFGGKEAAVSIPLDSVMDKFAECPTLVDTAAVSYDGTEASGCFKFVPAMNSRYKFFSTDATQYTYIGVYEENGYHLNYTYGYNNFSLTQALEAGKTYYIATRLSDSAASGEYTVNVERVKDVKAVSVTLADSTPLIIGDTTKGYWSDYYDYALEARVPYFSFYNSAVGPKLRITATYDDDTTAEFAYNGSGVYWSYDCTKWTAGGTANTVTVTIDEASGTVNIPLVSFRSQFEGRPTLALDTDTPVTYDGAAPSGAFFLTPAASGRYAISTGGDQYTVVALHDEQGRCLDDEWGTNASLTCRLEAGKTYIVLTRLNDSTATGEYTVTAVKKPAMTGLTLALKSEDSKLIIGYDGYRSSYWDAETSSYVYYADFSKSTIFNILTMTAVFEDDTTETLYYYSTLIPVTAEYDCKTWTVGGTANTLTVHTGDSGEITASINIPVVSYAGQYTQYPALRLDTPQTVTYTGMEASGALVFTPAENGTYYFYSTPETTDTYAELYDDWGSWVAYSDDAGGTTFSFLIERELEAGKDYVLMTRTYARNEGEYDVVVSMTKPEITEFSYESLTGLDLRGKMINLVFAVDTTGSMGDEINAVRSALQNFVTALSGTGALLRISLIDYRDIDADGADSTVLHYADDFSIWYENADVEELKTEIGGLVADGGGDTPESVVDALANVVDPTIMTFNSKAAKFVFVVTDADYWVKNNHGIESMEELIARLNALGVATSVITEKQYFGDYADLVSETGGVLINLRSDFEKAMAAFAADVASKTADYNADPSVIPVTGISLGVKELTVPEGKIKNFSVTVTPSNATNAKVTWEIKDTTIAEIDETQTTDELLVIRGKAEGKTVIVARSQDGGYVASFTLAVKDVVITEKTVESCDLDTIKEYAAKADVPDDLIYYADKTDLTSIAAADQAEIIDTIGGKKKTVTYVFGDELGDLAYQWKFEGELVNDADKAIAVDMKIDVGKDDSPAKAEAAKMDVSETLDFAHSGKFPTSKATVSVAVDLPDGEYGLYLYNEETGKLEKVGKATVKDHVATMDITHCSTYVIGISLSGTISGIDMYQSGSEITAIPTGIFDVKVSVTADEGDTLVYLACYTAEGAMVKFAAQSLPQGDTEITFTGVDNTAGKIAKLKAFVVTSTTDFGVKPIGGAMESKSS